MITRESAGPKEHLKTFDKYTALISKEVRCHMVSLKIDQFSTLLLVRHEYTPGP